MRPRSFSVKKTTWISAAAFVLTVAVCALGLYQTLLQYRAVHRLLVDSHRELASGLSPRVEEELDARLENTLEEIASRIGSPSSLRDYVASTDLAPLPFVVGATRVVRLPLAPERGGPDHLVAAQAMPEALALALRAASRDGPGASQLAGLRAAVERPDFDDRWRLRAQLAIGAIFDRSGDGAASLEAYRAAFELSGTGVGTGPGSALHVALAYARALLGRGQPDTARRVIDGALAHHAESAPVDTERFFVRAVAQLYRDANATPPPELAAHVRHLAVERQLAMSFANLPERPGAAGAESALALRVSPLSPELVAIWSAPRENDAPGAVAIGAVCTREAVAALASGALESFTAQIRYVIRTNARRRPEDDMVTLAALDAPYGFLTISLPAQQLEHLVGRARHPFVVAAILISTLALGLLLCLAVFVRGVRRELQLSAMKTEFVANVSHELKTPLALIRMFAETLLLRRVEDEKQKEKYYRIITRESERLTHLIANVLNFSSIEAGKKAYELRPIDLGGVVRDVVESYRYQLEAKGFESSLDIAENLPVVVADPDAVSQAVLNLIENAVKYSPEEKKIAITVRQTQRAVEISVADRGLGIGEEDRKRIWDDYYRTKEVRALGSRGSGLGLSLVLHIVRAHSGEVEVESEVGKGSRFVLRFPARAAVDTGTTTSGGTGRPGPGRPGPAKTEEMNVGVDPSGT